MLRKYSKALTFILSFVIIFTSISFENVAYADTKPEITRVELEAVLKDGTETMRYVIRGLNFDNPEILIGTYPITPDMYIIENGAYIIEQNDTNKHWDIWVIPYDGKLTEIKVVNSDSDGDSDNNTDVVNFKIEKLPHINSVSSSKVYVGNELSIIGTGFDITEIDAVYVAGTYYSKGYEQGTTPGETIQDIVDKMTNGIDDELDPGDGIADEEYQFIITTSGDIYIPSVEDPHTGADVKVVKDTGDKDSGDPKSVEGFVSARYEDAVHVVKEIDIIDPNKNKIIPNTGPIAGGTNVKIFDEAANSNLKPDMNIYMGSINDNNLFSDIELIMDETDNSKIIGISGNTPPSPTGLQGVFDIIITDKTGSNEQTLSNAYTYEETQNLLRLDKVLPNSGKPTEIVKIEGANIISLNIDKLQNIDIIGYKDDDNEDDDHIKKEIEDEKLINPDVDEPKYADGKYTLYYTGEYNTEPVQIKREIVVVIGKTSKVTGIVDTNPDTIEVEIPQTNEYGQVTVTVDTSTTVVYKSDIANPIINNRREEYELTNGFEILPANTIPVIESIEPTKGDATQKIYITIRGDNFLVVSDEDEEVQDVDDDPTYPDIEFLGHKILQHKDIIGVYDDDNNTINGKGRKIGTIIKAVIPADGPNDEGPVDLKITNPDKGYAIADDIFEFKKPDRDPNKLPKITKIDPNIGPLEGGNTITIEGENFDYQLPVPDVTVTIDGQTVKVLSASSSRVEVEVPPGLSIGEKPVQIITEDGAMDTIDPDDITDNRDGYTYVRILSDPEIERITPSSGGAGTIVYIFGKDKGIDNPNFFKPNKDPNVRIEEMIGTRVLFRHTDSGDGYGIDVNEIEEEYDSDGKLTGNVYYKTNGKITHVNGDAYENASKVEVIDRNTLRVEIPNKYAAGLKDVIILNPDSSSVIVEDGFKYKIPPSNTDVKITSIFPNLGSNLGGDYITIVGEDFKEGAQVIFGGYPSDKVDVISETEMLVKTPAYPLPDPDINGDYKDVEVVVVNVDGSSASLSNGYRFQVPVSNPDISSIEPNIGTTLGNEEVIIHGDDFREATDDITGETILPKVYFGGKEATITSFSYNKIVVKTPSYGKEDSVDVTVKNPQKEFGMITKTNAFEYRTSNPKITSVFPERAQKIGGEEITVKGTEILPGKFQITKVPIDLNNPVYEHDIDVLAIFGDEKKEDQVSSSEAQTVLGDLIIDYKANREEATFGTTDSLIIFYEEKKVEKILAHYNLGSDESRIFVLDWKAIGEKILNEDIGEIADEAIIVELIDDMLISRRRVAPRVKIVNASDDDPTKIVKIQTPPVLEVGERNLYIENQDKGWDKASFEYISPSSKPAIREIIPNNPCPKDDPDRYYVESTIEGGLYITIDGYDFRQGVEVFIDGVPAPLVSRNVLSNSDSEDPEGRSRTRLVVISPKGDAKKLNEELQIMIMNPDGGFVDASDTSKIVPGTSSAQVMPYYFVYRIPESNPYIDSILPGETSEAGGNEIRIIGYDFRGGITVVIGGVPCPTPISIENDEIVVKTPTDLSTGIKDVQVINVDHGAFTKSQGITVISYPEISQVTTEGGAIVDRVSIEGGAKIVLSGRHFQSGANVYFGGERKKIGDSDNAEIKGLFKDDDYYTIEEAYAANEVEFVNENQLIVTVPEVLKEGKYNITVLNSDGGISDEDKLLDYRVPIPTDPIGLKAEIVNDKYIRIYGYSSSNVSYYEVYTCIDEDYPDDDDFKYLDTTEKTSYKITKFKELDDDENIYLRIRAVNKYGPSEWSNIAKISYRVLDDIDGIGNEDTDGDLVSDYQESIGSDGVNIVLGNNDLKGKDYYIYVIDLKDKKYDKIDKRIINIPGKTIRNSNKALLMDNGDTKLQFNVRNFYVYSFINLSSKEQENTYGRIIFNRASGKDSEYMQRKIPRKYKLISRVYDIKAEFQMDEKTTKLDSMAGYMDLEISYDENRLMGIKESKLQLYKYYAKEGKWIPLAGGVNPDTNKVYARIDGPGQYAILGEK